MSERWGRKKINLTLGNCLPDGLPHLSKMGELGSRLTAKKFLTGASRAFPWRQPVGKLLSRLHDDVTYATMPPHSDPPPLAPETPWSPGHPLARFPRVALQLALMRYGPAASLTAGCTVPNCSADVGHRDAFRPSRRTARRKGRYQVPPSRERNLVGGGLGTAVVHFQHQIGLRQRLGRDIEGGDRFPPFTPPSVSSSWSPRTT